MMDNMNTTERFTAEADHQGYGLIFGLTRTRAEKCFVLSRIQPGKLGIGGADLFLTFPDAVQEFEDNREKGHASKVFEVSYRDGSFIDVTRAALERIALDRQYDPDNMPGGWLDRDLWDYEQAAKALLEDAA